MLIFSDPWLNEPLMPLSDIATPQPSFRSQFCSIRFQRVSHGSFLFGNKETTRLGSGRRYSCIPDKPNNFINTPRGGGFMIKAVTTLQPRRFDLQTDNVEPLEIDSASSLPAAENQSSSEDSTDLDEKERLKRMKISKAMKGKTPWNKGRKHSPETLQRIREKTKLAMQNPKVKMKLAHLALGQVLSNETKGKIGIAMRIHNERRREKLMVQEACHFEWLNLIAEASRKGLRGEEELQWDSYEIITEQLEKERRESIKHRKREARAPLSSEQRKKIAEAIAAKWADNSYRARHSAGMREHHATDRQPRYEKMRKEVNLQEGCHFEWLGLIAEASRKGLCGEELQWDSYEIISERLQKEWRESTEHRKRKVRVPLSSEVVPEIFHFQWLDLIAEASRKGLRGQEELQWDSYEIMNEQLQNEWIENIEERKNCKRKLLSLNHRKHRSAAQVLETCHFEWLNLIAEASRKGLCGQEELQWDSYKIMNEQLKKEWIESPDRRKNRFADEVQETCHFEWLDLIAEASRKGLHGQEELQWDSYEVMSEQLKNQYIEGKKLHKREFAVEHRARISAGLREYRVRVSQPGYERPSEKVNVQETCHLEWLNLIAETSRKGLCGEQELQWDSYNVIREQLRPKSKKTDESLVKTTKLKRSKLPMYKDPEANYKLEMIKIIRAQRAAADTKRSEAITRAQTAAGDSKKREAIARAKNLIAEAQSGVDALEIAAATSPVAQATLIETRKIIAEAMRSLRALENSGDATDKEGLSQTDHRGTGRTRSAGLSDAEIMDFGFRKLDREDDDEPSTSFNERDLVKGIMGLSDDVEIMDFDFSKMDLEDDDEFGRLVNGDVHPLTPSNHLDSSTPDMKRKQELQRRTSNKTKRWVRGKLVEVDEDD